jgi:hypothetical protein
VQLSTRDQQYIAKMKRDELDYTKLQKSLQNLMKTKDKVIKAGIDISERNLKMFLEKRNKGKKHYIPTYLYTCI